MIRINVYPGIYSKTFSGVVRMIRLDLLDMRDEIICELVLRALSDFSSYGIEVIQ